MSEDQVKSEVTQYQLQVPEGYNANQRLDRYITDVTENATRNKVQQAIKNGYVQVNGKNVKPSYLMQAGDVIDIELPRPPRPDPEPENIPLNIIYEDDDLIVLNKPAEMVVHPAQGNWKGTLVNGLLYHVDQLSSQSKDNLRPGIVHRLDKDTSGLMVVAKKDEPHSQLSKALMKREIDRRYWAIVWGHPEKEGTIDTHIGRSPRDRKRMAVVSSNNGKRAITHYKVLEYFDHMSLVEIKLQTGRTHQIRVHFQHNRTPVFGDPVYGGSKVIYGPNSGPRRVMFNTLFKVMRRQCLHAKELRFEHPTSGEIMEFSSDLPADFHEVLTTMREQCYVSDEIGI